jgi:hypothetical protein
MGIDSTRTWLKNHGAAERSFGRALRLFFQQQADRIADAIGENFPGGPPSPDQTSLIFRADDEHELLRPIIKRNLAGLLLTGARAEARRAAQSRRDGKAFDDFDDMPDLPPETLAGLRRALSELEQQDYWRAIQDETEAQLTKIISDAIEERLGTYAIGMRIREHLGGIAANKRAQKIARTESTGAMNSGHMAFAEELIADGIVTGKEWSSILDNDCRESHAALNGKVVPARGMFIVGSSPAPHPGHWSLPARERVNCRCVVLSVFSEAIVPSGGGSSYDNNVIQDLTVSFYEQ